MKTRLLPEAVFQIRASDIRMLAVTHARRRPGYWRNRIANP